MPAPGPAVPGVLYVDDDAPPGGDGLSWQAAHRFLQDALDSARAPGSAVTEIRIAQGEYKPDQGANVTPLDVQASFWVHGGLTLVGGYVGLTGINPDERNVSLYVSTLTGDLRGDDGALGSTINNADNSIHICQVFSGPLDAAFDGIRFVRSRFFGPPDNEGGAIHSQNGGVRLAHCAFEGNKAFKGGAIGLRSSRGTITDCRFTNNRSTGGGAAYIRGSSDVTFRGCHFEDNSIQSGTAGGAVLSTSNSFVRIEDCRFVSNSSSPVDGGALGAGSTHPAIIVDSVFEGNYGDYGGAIVGAVDATDCDFLDNSAYAHGAADCAPGSTFTNCRFVGNHSTQGSGAVDGQDTHFSRCLFLDNHSLSARGGAIQGSGLFVNCRFLSNSGYDGGGAVSCDHHLPSQYVNCVFSGNSSQFGASVIDVSGNVPVGLVSLVNCTLSSSMSGTSGPAIHGPARVINTIVWGHAIPAIVHCNDVTFSCVQGGAAGEGNIDGDPRFVDHVGPDGLVGTEDDDLRLRADSLCIDAGNSMALPADVHDLDGDGDVLEPLPLDALGNARMLETPATPNTGHPSSTDDAVTDIGAHEFRRWQDIAPQIGDGRIDIADLLQIIVHWGPCPARGPCLGDLDLNGEVAMPDLMQVILNWG